MEKRSKKNYQELKETVRNEAIDWQNSWQDYCYSYGEIVDWSDYFYKNAKRYRLVKEFRENGII